VAEARKTLPVALAGERCYAVRKQTAERSEAMSFEGGRYGCTSPTPASGWSEEPAIPSDRTLLLDNGPITGDR